ncbi:MAG: GTPase ObgE [Armatimonadetes bacterium CG_4_10_14_3_um_filter_66_18]|nr:GTPase ObgE [Armatimonadota bacterium]OIO95398.1 MAG: hypothetical protein AUJ96_26855 [Armatimonadetes bacterium CG2_30_66_41]PIU91858.1 MAG: GTPase ObgE [Armatimonadetes bacterium CG06_land_8_20_14_3_00_66_21]PIX46773.1 MAG: GTPase ObgE [Armatimonadetes bacterium CG_4_8_14_3_um_filter_66_20]PIY37586.1 MAG: GTPase ObgE [Armatimonadetes bacterium CG_4_10_14_3_um_filter_66_18]PIZ47757.1 MAG: GTPase ObgE [Armatimonadetes bacterium CG_4_10_14_0_8_um_filter_66_14]PJB74121.1 MAG: GTPase ObgE [A
MFIDEATIYVKGGAGGNGAVSFRREFGEPHGGPDGGRGGNGGSVILVARDEANTLIDFQFQRHYRGKNGTHGGGSRKSGAAGDDLLVSVPLGTLVYEGATGDLLADLTDPGTEFVAARGGRGGRGNRHFATAIRRTPRFAEKGDDGEEREVRLELKLLADVGLIGFPNAGKSTLISRISAARPKIADYPFTTLVPNLGTVRLDRGESLVVADIPGIIEGAHEGRGLGDQFLRHVERTSVLVHLLDMTMPADRDPVADFVQMNEELAKFSPVLAERPQLLAPNKLDVPDARECFEMLAAELKALGVPVYPISGVTGEGVPELIRAMAEQVRQHPRPAATEVPALPRRTEDPFEVRDDGPGVWRLSGGRVERVTARFNVENFEAARHLYQLFERMGVMDELRDRGAKDGDLLRIGEVEMAYLE